MHLNRSKPLKALPAEETVENIRHILEAAGFHFFEKQVAVSSSFFASRLNMINPATHQVIYNSYGKGTTAGWASASAWGEMIERIQNMAFYTTLLYPAKPELWDNPQAGFNYFPDEKVCSIKDGTDPTFMANFNTMTGISTEDEEEMQKAISIPFNAIFNHTIEYFPFRVMQVIVGSNGMCSGNTKEEALIQGISEVYERYVMKSMYLSPFCPPDIPLSHFKGTQIFSFINNLEKGSGLRVHIKDCSMGKGYPVIGVLIRNAQQEYAFHLGADPSPVTALERCFTEIFQGGNICFQSLDILEKFKPYKLDTDFWRRNLLMTIRAYRGHWPPAVISDSPDYSFSGFLNPDSYSDEDDLLYLLQLLKSENRKLFIRDNSFLGHPSFQIYIPGMSEITNCIDPEFSTVFLKFDHQLPLLTNLKGSSIEQRKQLTAILKQYIMASPIKQFIARDYFMYNKLHPLAQFTSEQFMQLMNSSVHEKELFDRLDVPECFRCADCNRRSTCDFPYITSIWEGVKEKMTKYSFDQVDLLNYTDASV